MLWVIFLGTLTLWLLFVISSWTLGGFLNVLLFAVAAFAFQVLTHGDTPA